MKQQVFKFIAKCALFLMATILFFEIALTTTKMSTDLHKRCYDKDSLVLFEPGSEGYYRRGLRAEVSSFNHINSQGWNSRKNYDEPCSAKIAILGDSFIANMWNDVDSSVAEILEDSLQRYLKGFVVHNYGNPGANFKDYEIMIPILQDKGYKYVFVYIGAKDFKPRKPSYAKIPNFKEKTGIQSFYRKSALLRYLNVQLDAQDLFINKKKEKEQKILTGEEINKTKERILQNHVNGFTYWFYEDDAIDKIRNLDSIMFKIEHKLLPKDHGFNSHWNVNGNANAANSIYSFLMKKSLLSFL